MQESRILVVEDEAEIRRLISLHLRREGFAVDEVEGGEDARRALKEQVYDLVVLDWMLPGMSGIEVTRWIRTQESLNRVPILFLTALVEPSQVASGLDAGADDYLGKPFDNMVLMARVNALLRRRQWLTQTSENKKVQVGALVLDPQTYEVTLSGVPMELTRSEFRLMQALMENQGKVLSREQLIECIQGEGVNVVGRTVDTHVFGLRKKLADHAEIIETIRGVGYRVRYLAS